ncbi:hypothetical protein AALA58_02220, partial [Lactococcus ileimucosae]
HDDLSDFLTAVQNGSIDNNWGNPGPDDNVQPDQINFSIMAPGTIFTMAGEQYRYLENMSSGNHLIIRNDSFLGEGVFQQDNRLNTWYAALDPAVQAMTQPVADSFDTGVVAHADIVWAGQDRWLPANLHAFPEVEADITQVDPSGTPRAFALSLADVVRLSGPGRAFTDFSNRATDQGENDGWLLRTHTVVSGHRVWTVGASFHNLRGRLNGGGYDTGGLTPSRGVRPAIIVHQ